MFPLKPVATVGLLLGALLAGCATSDDGQDPPATFAFTERRVDVSGDGVYDAVNVTLLGAPGNVTSDRLLILLDDVEQDPTLLLANGTWEIGAALLVECPPGIHRLEVWIDGRAREVVVTECGVPAAVQPPAFQARLIDPDGDGLDDTVELTLLSGGPVEPDGLSARAGDATLRIYADASRSRVLRQPLYEGARAYVACDPDAGELALTFRDQALPVLPVRGCDLLRSGVDVPARWDAVDVDGDGLLDGWNVSLFDTGDGPFAIEELSASWGNRTAVLNASTRLDAPPPSWSVGDALVVTCPGEGTFPFGMTVRNVTIFETLSVCEEPPGRPLVALELTASGAGLVTRLEISRLGPLDGASLSSPTFELDLSGVWAESETRTLPCPGGTLILHVDGRLAYRGTAPC